MKSMTGFGRAEVSLPEQGIRFSVEISGVNRKQLDLRVALPREVQFFELKLRELVAEQVSRGTVFVRIDFQTDATGGNALRVDHRAAAELCRAAEMLRKELSLSGELTIAELLTIPGVVVPVSPDFASENITRALEDGLRNALRNYDAMRTREGENLFNDFITRLDFLTREVERLQSLTDSLAGVFRERILGKIREAEVMFASDEDRLMKEVFFYCQKADVAEELTRLRSHLCQMRENLKVPQSGRKLEFIVQEMQREITTLGNKAPGVEITPIIVNFKTEIDRMKEQIQNVE